MATQTIQSWAVTGETLTMNVYTYDSDTAVDSAAATEATNRDGLYSAAFTDLPADTYIVQLETAGGVVRSFFWVTTEDSTGTYQAYDQPVSAMASAVWDELLTGATHNVPTSAGKRLRQVADIGVYEGGQVWIDTVNGTAGTASYENGTVDLPSDNIADATTLATAVAITRFKVAPNSNFTLASGYTGFNFSGDGKWTLGQLRNGHSNSSCL